MRIVQCAIVGYVGRADAAPRTRFEALDVDRERHPARDLERASTHPLALSCVRRAATRAHAPDLLRRHPVRPAAHSDRRSTIPRSRRRRTRSRAGRATRRRGQRARRAPATGWARPPADRGRTRARGLRARSSPSSRAATRSDEARLRQASFCGPSPAMRSRTGRPSRREARAAARMRTSPPLSVVIRPAKSTVSGSPLAAIASAFTDGGEERKHSQAVVRHAVTCHLVAHVLARHDHRRVAREERPLLTRPSIAPASSRRERAGRTGAGSRARGTPARTSG